MDLFITILFSLLLVLQFTVFSARLSKVQKSAADLVIMLGAVVLATLIARQFGFLFIRKPAEAPLDFQLLMPLLANLLAGIGCILAPILVLDEEPRVKYKMLPGMKAEIFSTACMVFSAAVLYYLTSMGG
jgi:hypothetical protein